MSDGNQNSETKLADKLPDPPKKLNRAERRAQFFKRKKRGLK